MTARCPRCRRPLDHCVCRDLVPARSRTRVVILQHPREWRLAICSAWLARLALENAELHCGVRFEEGSRELEYLKARRRALGGDRPRRSTRPACA